MDLTLSCVQQLTWSVTITGHGKALLDKIIEVEGLDDTKIIRAEIRALIADGDLLSEHQDGVQAFLADLIQEDLKTKRVEIADWEDPQDIEES